MKCEIVFNFNFLSILIGALIVEKCELDMGFCENIFNNVSILFPFLLGLLPKSALTVEEEAWNAYPYTRTRYTCPFVEKFSLDIETYYHPDNGYQDNVFQLSGSDLRNRVVGEYFVHRLFLSD